MNDRPLSVPRGCFIIMMTCTCIGLGALVGEGFVWAIMGSPSKHRVEQEGEIQRLRHDLTQMKIEYSKLRWRTDELHRRTEFGALQWGQLWDEPAPIRIGEWPHITKPSPVIPPAAELIPPTNIPER